MNVLDLLTDGQSGSARRFACPDYLADGEVCPKTFTRHSNILRYQRIYSKYRPFSCSYPICTQSFIQRSAQTVHERVHTGERPHACQSRGCEKRFADSSSLARHGRIHNGSRPYKCDVCLKTFCRKLTLTKHINTRHRRSLSRSSVQLPGLDDGVFVPDYSAGRLPPRARRLLQPLPHHHGYALLQTRGLFTPPREPSRELRPSRPARPKLRLPHAAAYAPSPHEERSDNGRVRLTSLPLLGRSPPHVHPRHHRLLPPTIQLHIPRERLPNPPAHRLRPSLRPPRPPPHLPSPNPSPPCPLSPKPDLLPSPSSPLAPPRVIHLRTPLPEHRPGPRYLPRRFSRCGGEPCSSCEIVRRRGSARRRRRVGGRRCTASPS